MSDLVGNHEDRFSHKEAQTREIILSRQQKTKSLILVTDLVISLWVATTDLYLHYSHMKAGFFHDMAQKCSGILCTVIACKKL